MASLLTDCVVAGLLSGVLGCTGLPLARAQTPAATQSQSTPTSLQYALRVNGEPVVTTRPPSQFAGEWFVPLAPVARALGVDLRIDPTAQSLHVVRTDGGTASYEAATGRILQGAILAAQVANFRQVQLNVGLENIMFPIDGVIALFGVTVREDVDREALEIESLPSTGGTSGAGGNGPRFQVASLEDRYVMSTNGVVWQQAINLRGSSMLGLNRLSGTLDLGGGAGGSFLAFRQGFVRMETPQHRVITLGDQGTYNSVDALSNTVRGLGYQWRWNKFTVDVYGGLAASSVSSGLGTSGLAVYDTTLGGFGLRRKSKTFDFSVGANGFRGTQRNGVTFGAGFSGVYRRNEFKIQALAGDFSGNSLRPVLQLVTATTANQSAANAPLDNLGVATPAPGSVIQVDQAAGHVSGGAYGFSVADTFTPFKNTLTINTLLERYSKNFLVTRDDSRFSAASRRSLSATLRPVRYISFMGSLHDSQTLLGDPNPEKGYTYGVNGSTPGRITIQPGYFRSVQTSAGQSRFVLSQYSLQLPQLKRFAASATYSETEFAGARSRTATENFIAELKRYGKLGFHDQMQLKSNHNFGVDWSQQFGKNGAYFMGGLERQTGLGQRSSFAPTVSFRVPLPRKQNLTVSYYSVRGSSLFRFEIGGPIVRRKEIVGANNSQTVLVVPASLGGQIYHDVDLNGSFTAGVDRPISQLKVWLDDESSTTTDAGGYFRFDGIPTGTHRVRVEMATLPANLIFASDEMKVAVMPYRANRQDFRAIPAGKIQGTVTISRMDDAGKEQFKVFPDARILASDSRDTYAEGDGAFVLGDLPPGTYSLRLDPATVPRGFVARPSLQTVEVKPGKSTDNVEFRLVRPVVVKQAPPIALRGGVEGFVRETRDGERVPVAGVTIGIDDRMTAVTDAKGYYLILQVPEGEHQVSVLIAKLPAAFRPGAVKEGKVMVKPNRNTVVDFEVLRTGPQTTVTSQ